MRVYRFHLPDTGNDGRDYGLARAEWLHQAAFIAGGYTLLGEARGLWRDGSATYAETMHIVEVAVEDGADSVRGHLVALAKQYFPDQLAIYSAEVGQAWIE